LVNFLTSSTAIAATQDVRTALGPGDLSDVRRVNAVALDDALTHGIFGEVRIALRKTESRTGMPLGTLVNKLG
jgi:hypothetical protein